MRWSRDFAYAVGLIASDGCLYNDGRHLSLTSKDLEQVKHFKNILKLKNKIGLKSSGKYKYRFRTYYHLQFGNVKLYKFLESIGLTQRKSKVIGALKIPDKYFADFLRGSFDGDGYSISYWSKQWPKSFVIYTGFTSASKSHLVWLKSKIENLYNIKGYISTGGRGTFLLRYAKYSSLKLYKQMYYSQKAVYLSRKKKKIDDVLRIISKHAEVAELADAPS